MTNFELKNERKKLAKKNAIIKTLKAAGIFGLFLVGGGIPAFMTGITAIQVFLCTFGVAGIAALTITGVADYKKTAKQIEKEYIDSEYAENQEYIVEEYVPETTASKQNYQVKGNTIFVEKDQDLSK
ncbi:MAG: MFS transporter [Clostridiales bacterium]|nr:MFS transporter [Clostridiales bacterium]